MDARSQKAMQIVKENRALCNEGGYYTVESDMGGKSYAVIAMESGLHCTCPDHRFRKVECKHIKAVKAVGAGDDVLPVIA